MDSDEDRVVCCKCWRWLNKDDAIRLEGEWYCPKCHRLETNEEGTCQN